MPLPKKKTGESQSKFMSRCVNDLNVKNEFKTREQRIAVCYKIYRDE